VFELRSVFRIYLSIFWFWEVEVKMHDGFSFLLDMNKDLRGKENERKECWFI
jgi:hypothetical protein